jgi:lysine-specific demethylase/histidyl-hydroxylase NO66
MRTPSTRTPGPRIPPASRGPALARCVEPVAADTFLAEYFERRPLVLERDAAAGFDDLLSEADVARRAGSSVLRTPAIRLVKAGESITPSDYTVDVPWRPTAFTEVADPGRIAALFAEGATVVVQGLHHWWEPLAVFCRALELELGHAVQANAYYTPRDSQGLPVHHDTHEVFVLQVAGEKRWLVYEPVLELPLRDQRYRGEMGAPGEPVHDVVLHPGDTLYLPRGWLHEAVTSHADSLHLTVGVNLYTWTEAVQAALAEAAADLELRRSVPSSGEGAAEVVRALEARLEPEAVARRMRRRFVRTRRSILPDQMAQLRALRRLGLETPVERRPTVVAELTRAGGRVTLAFEGKRVAFPAAVEDEVKFAAAADAEFRAADLPGGLDEEGRLVLVRRLVREGFLRISERALAGPSLGGDGDGTASAPNS